ncbi:MAG TPA: hypothetical protein VHF22_00210, partial [Planctomycetota bacterium]|nr:hypothetical protein [Planctomycetota bacterium]
KEFDIELQQPSNYAFATGLVPGQQVAARVRITSAQSSDQVTPGLEIITDPTAQSTIHAPGPVYFATAGPNSSNQGLKFLVSSPDPRQ